MGENRQSIAMVMKEDYDDLRARYEHTTGSLMDRYLEIRDLTDANARLQERYDTLQARFEDATRTIREECAALIDEMAKRGNWSEHKWARMALKTASSTIRRGRHLNYEEKFANLVRYLWGAA